MSLGPGSAGTGAASSRAAPAPTPTTSEDCRIVAYVNSIQAYWVGAARLPLHARPRPSSSPGDRRPAAARPDRTGPVLLPAQTRIVYSISASSTSCARKFGAQGGPFAEAYVLAHEYGHHVQDLAGTLDKCSQPTAGPQSGVGALWSCRPTALPGCGPARRRTGFITAPNGSDIAEGLDAAAAVGDDRIQKEIQGRVTPERWTHGSSQQRQYWFVTGYKSGNLRLQHLHRHHQRVNNWCLAPIIHLVRSAGEEYVSCGAATDHAGRHVPGAGDGAAGRDHRHGRPPVDPARVGGATGNLEWIANAYTLTLASTILLGGTLGDRYGRRRVFLIGLVVFTAGIRRVRAGARRPQLIALRGIQGLGGAAMAPMTLSLLVAAFPGPQAPRAVGIWAAVGSLGFGLGPVIGGAWWTASTGHRCSG